MPLLQTELHGRLPAHRSQGVGSACGEGNSAPARVRTLQPRAVAASRRSSAGLHSTPSVMGDPSAMGDDPDPPRSGSDSFDGEGESENPTVVVAPPRRQQAGQPNSQRQPRYHVLLWDSSDHTFAYVEKMLRELFGHEAEQCKLLAKEVDQQGRAVVFTTTMEHAELKRDQIHAYGRDHLEGSKGSMWSTIEPDR